MMSFVGNRRSLLVLWAASTLMWVRERITRRECDAKTNDNIDGPRFHGLTGRESAGDAVIG